VNKSKSRVGQAKKKEEDDEPGAGGEKSDQVEQESPASEDDLKKSSPKRNEVKTAPGPGSSVAPTNNNNNNSGKFINHLFAILDGEYFGLRVALKKRGWMELPHFVNKNSGQLRDQNIIVMMFVDVTCEIHV
jgi:hypothetical protein